MCFVGDKKIIQWTGSKINEAVLTSVDMYINKNNLK